ncbi:hypothetical protein AAEX63_03810 [Luteococcus sp. H138]|uniref:hypothetical protein n=1 Tax=unclassified Luteococcus TaxID=2639923 RepID=UPI00313D6AD0
MSARQPWRRWAHLALALAGLAVVVYGLVSVANPSITCRGVQMQPGDVCHKNDFSRLGTQQVQTYEERLHSARISQPVVVATGAAVALFGLALYRREAR